MNERELLVDCLRRLYRSGITYYLTGSMASNYWGIPRTTHDLDFVVQLSDPQERQSFENSAETFISTRKLCVQHNNRRINSTPSTLALH